MRTVRILSVATAGLALLLSGCAGGSPDAAPGGDSELSGELVWADYGGPTNEAFADIFFDPFTEKTGVEVVPTVMSASVMYSMFDGEPGDYDTVMTGMPEVVRYGENLLPVPKGITESDLLPPEIAEFAIATPFVGYAQGYLSDTFPNGGPQTWADFWDVEKFPGKRAVPGEYFDFMFEAALLADGVPVDELYPLDVERALDKLNELKPDMVFYTEYPQVPQLLSAGAASVAFAPNGQFASLASSGADVTVSWNQAFVEANPFVVPVQAPNPDAVFALAEMLADPKLQAEFARRTNYGPWSAAAFDELSPEEVAKLPNAPEHTEVVTSDAQNRADLYEELNDRYAEWLST